MKEYLFSGRWRELDVQLFTLGGVSFSLSSLLKLVLLMVALFWLAGQLRRWTINRVLRHTHFAAGTRQTFGAVAQYLVLGIGLVVILQNAGINLSALGVVAGAVGVGVGFGLQNIITNFVSGLIIMVEQPIRVGDRVELANIEGIVREIGARRTTLTTPDHVTVLVPNQRFILENVVNLMHGSGAIRLRVPVLAPEGIDPEAVSALLLAVARDTPQVLDEPGPQVLRPSLSATPLLHELCVWHTPDLSRQQLASDLNTEIDKRLRAQPRL